MGKERHGDRETGGIERQGIERHGEGDTWG